MLLVISNRRLVQSGVSTTRAGQLTIRHWEQIDNHLRWGLACTTRIVRTDITLPTVVLNSIAQTREVYDGVVQGGKYGLRISSCCSKHLRKCRTVDARITFAKQSVATTINDRLVSQHFLISLLIAVNVTLTVEQRAAPQCEHTTLQSQCSTRGHTTVVSTLPTAGTSERQQEFSSLVQVGNDEINTSLSRRTRSK